MVYHGFQLESFQEQAINAINENKDVIISTYTGNGKTLVADYTIEKCLNEDKKVIYTAPIKALSNQKYREMLKLYGEDKVGLVTGDISINQNAPLLLVTTEILRNILHEDPDRVKDLAYIILDEIHYINDRDRGTVWEEIIIFRNKETKILGLSATIPNAKDLSDWISNISGNNVELIVYNKRIIEQTHEYFDKKYGPIDFCEMTAHLNYFYNSKNRPHKNSHIDFLKYAQKEKLMPCLMFAFSRKQCEEYAINAAQRFSLLNNKEISKIENLIYKYESEHPELIESNSWNIVRDIATSGIVFHHAGVLPLAKKFIEEIFEQKLCKVLYATETFAVGLNFPVKTVCFVALRKFDGMSFRNIYGSEYFQMAGRAGRRGFDDYGKVFTLANYDDLERGRLPDIKEFKPEPIQSQFSLSYNTVLNLITNYKEENIKSIFEKGLSDYQYKLDLQKFQPNCKYCNTTNCPIIFDEKKRKDKHFSIEKNRIRKCDKSKKKQCAKYYNLIRKNKEPSKAQEKEFNKKVDLLKDLFYLAQDGTLSNRGLLCKNFHIQEVFLTELLIEEDLLSKSFEEICGVIAGLCYDGKLDETKIKEPYIEKTLNFLISKEVKFHIYSKSSFSQNSFNIMKEWVSGKSFQHIEEYYEIEEGDFVSLCRRTIDVLRQIKKAYTSDEHIQKICNECIKIIDRDIVTFFI